MAGGRSLPVYSTGTVTVANVSGVWTVTGAATNFIAPDGVANYTLLGGDLFVCDGGFGTIANVASAASLTLDFWYGPTVSAGAAYKIYRYEGLASNAVVALLNNLLTLLTDANPPPAMTVDTGAVRFKLDDDGAGNMRLRVRPSGASDSAYVTALLINDATGAATEYTTQTGQLVVDDGSVRTAITEIAGTATLAVGPAGTAVASLTPALKFDSANGAVSFPSGAYAAADWTKNRIINGGFPIWQNGVTFSIANNTTAYTADQWIVFNSATGASLSCTKAETIGPSLQNISLTISGMAALSSVSLAQRFESHQLRDLGAQEVSLSFSVEATTSAGSLTGYVQFAANTVADNATFSAFNPAVSFNVPTSGIGRVSISMPATATANIQKGAQLQITFVQNTSAGNVSITIAGVVLEKGAVANPWAPKSKAQELVDCQRFFACSWPNEGSAATDATPVWLNAATSYANDSYIPIGQIAFPVQMRGAPALTIYDDAGTANAATINFTNGQSVSGGSPSAVMFNSIYNSSGSTVTAGENITFHWSANARL